MFVSLPYCLSLHQEGIKATATETWNQVIETAQPHLEKVVRFLECLAEVHSFALSVKLFFFSVQDGFVHGAGHFARGRHRRRDQSRRFEINREHHGGSGFVD